MTNASPSTTAAATTAPSSENTGRSPPGPNCSASPPARLPKSFMSVSMRRRRTGLTAQPQPAPAPQSGGSMQGNNSPVNKRTVRHRRKIDAAPPPRHAGRPRSPFFRRGFPDCAVASVGPCGKLTTPIFDRSRARCAPHHDVYRPYRPPSAFADAFDVGARRLRINTQ